MENSKSIHSNINIIKDIVIEFEGKKCDKGSIYILRIYLNFIKESERFKNIIAQVNIMI